MNVNDGDRVTLILFFAVLISIGLRLAYLVLRSEKPVKVRKVTTIKFDQSQPVQDNPHDAVIAQWEQCAGFSRAEVDAEIERQSARIRADEFARKVERSIDPF